MITVNINQKEEEPAKSFQKEEEPAKSLFLEKDIYEKKRSEMYDVYNSSKECTSLEIGPLIHAVNEFQDASYAYYNKLTDIRHKLSLETHKEIISFLHLNHKIRFTRHFGMYK